MIARGWLDSGTHQVDAVSGIITRGDQGDRFTTVRGQPPYVRCRTRQEKSLSLVDAVRQVPDAAMYTVIQTTAFAGAGAARPTASTRRPILPTSSPRVASD